MKHKVKALVEVEKNGLFGKKKVLEYRTVEVDTRTYAKILKERPYTVEEMMFYDAIWGD